MDNESRRKSQSGVAVIDAGAAWARGLDPPFFTAAIVATTAIAHTPAATARVVSWRLRMRHFYASGADATSVSQGRFQSPPGPREFLIRTKASRRHRCRECEPQRPLPC
jgi:hypothetical protein